jgi:putative glutamine amidotransferase
MASRARIGVSCNLLPGDPERSLYRGKALQYVEAKLARAVHRAGAVPVVIPDLDDPEAAPALLDGLDGLLLSGGADVAPGNYGQAPLRPEWAGDPQRDAYERALVDVALARAVPVLGVCRGLQLLNVALGGSLWQDLGTQLDGALVHRDWHRYDELEHPVRIAAGSWIAGVHGAGEHLVNSVHHQAIRALAPALRASAWAPDGVVEAVEHVDPARFAAAVQWHPEWLDGSAGAPERLPGAPVFAAFVARCSGRAPA